MKISFAHEGKAGTRDIARQTVLIGRGAGAGGPDLDLSPDIHVSRRHALLTEREGSLWIEDLGSKLGTMVNGQPIQQEGQWRLRPGDRIEVGDTTLRVEPSAPPASPPAGPALALEEVPTEFHLEVALNAGDLRLLMTVAHYTALAVSNHQMRAQLIGQSGHR